MGRPEEKRSRGIPRCRWDDNIKMDLQAVGWRGVDWIGLTQDRDRWRTVVITACLTITVPLASFVAALCPGTTTAGLSIRPADPKLYPVSHSKRSFPSHVRNRFSVDISFTLRHCLLLASRVRFLVCELV